MRRETFHPQCHHSRPCLLGPVPSRPQMYVALLKWGLTQALSSRSLDLNFMFTGDFIWCFFSEVGEYPQPDPSLMQQPKSTRQIPRFCERQSPHDDDLMCSTALPITALVGPNRPGVVTRMATVGLHLSFALWCWQLAAVSDNLCLASVPNFHLPYGVLRSNKIHTSCSV